jgi:hypothetical protein
MMKFIKKIINFFAGKSSVEIPEVEMPEVSEIPEVPVQVSSKKKLWKFIIQTLINILAAILTALGASAAVVH